MAEKRFNPVLEGLGDGFEIEDELYLFEVFEDDVLPLLRSDHAFEESGFFSAALAVKGQIEAQARRRTMLVRRAATWELKSWVLCAPKQIDTRRYSGFCRE